MTQCHCSQQDFAPLHAIIKEYAGQPGSLISVLQQAQVAYGYLSGAVMREIAKGLALPPAKVYGVATFYTQFRHAPIGKHLIMLCQGTACYVNGSKEIEEAITEELGIADGETTSDGLFTLENVACLGCCSLSPAMMIGERVYGNLTPAATRKILKEIRAGEKG